MLLYSLLEQYSFVRYGVSPKSFLKNTIALFGVDFNKHQGVRHIQVLGCYCSVCSHLENILVSIAYDLAAPNLSEEKLNAQKDV